MRQGGGGAGLRQIGRMTVAAAPSAWSPRPAPPLARGCAPQHEVVAAAGHSRASSAPRPPEAPVTRRAAVAAIHGDASREIVVAFSVDMNQIVNQRERTRVTPNLPPPNTSRRVPAGTAMTAGAAETIKPGRWIHLADADAGRRAIAAWGLGAAGGPGRPGGGMSATHTSCIDPTRRCRTTRARSARSSACGARARRLPGRRVAQPRKARCAPTGWRLCGNSMEATLTTHVPARAARDDTTQRITGVIGPCTGR